MILHEILAVKGYESRTIQLIRQVGSRYDTHVVTEVFSNKLKKYILLDPTFNLVFKSNGNYINADELKNIVLYKQGQQLSVIETIDPKVLKYKEYPLSYFSLYNNVLIVRANNLTGYSRLVSKLPVLHSYLGRKYYVKSDDSTIGVSVLYNIFYIYVPLFLLFNIVIIILLRIKNIIKRDD